MDPRAKQRKAPFILDQNWFYQFGAFFLFLVLLAGFKDAAFCRQFFLIVNTAIPIHHAISQTRGLSLAYNTALTKPHPPSILQTQRLKANERRERLAFQFFIPAAMTTTFLLFVSTPILCTVFGSLMGAAALAILINVATFPLPGKLRKLGFLFRLALWPLTPFSMMARVGTMAVHGIEYGCVTRKMMTTSQGSANLWIVAGLTVLIAVGAFYRDVFMSGISENTGFSALNVLAALSTAVSFSHYYLDRMMFRMRNPINRSYCGALLWN